MPSPTRVTLAQLDIPDQYGLSYRAIQSKGAGNATLTVKKEADWVPGQVFAGTMFIKCPDRRASKAERLNFLREFDSGYAINEAAKHLADRASSRTPNFDIPKMIAKGSLEVAPDQKPLSCLIYHHAAGTMLHKLNFQKNNISDDNCANDVLDFAYQLARAVQVLHNQGVVHSFLVPRHVLCATEIFSFRANLSLVGFGYARLCDAQGKVPREFKISRNDNCFRAPETRVPETYKAYWFPADIYSIGALLYYLLLRHDDKWTDNEARRSLLEMPKDVRRLKDKVAEDLEQVVPIVIRRNENILKIIDSCLRSDQEQRFSCVEELMDAIDIARTAGQHNPTDQSSKLSTNPSPKSYSDETTAADEIALISISTNDTHSTSPPPPQYFEHFKKTLAFELAQNFRSISRGHLEIYGSRERIIRSLCRLLGSARKQHIYDTVTLPGYWTDDNIGSMGRFLTMNKHMVRCGVDIRRVFLVSKSFHELTENEQVILETQLSAWNAIEKERKDQVDGYEKYGKFKIYVHNVENEDKITEFENVGSTVAYLGPKGDPQGTVCLNFFSTAKAEWNKGKVVVTRSIKKVRYWAARTAEKRFKENEKEFEKHVAKAVSLRKYVRGEYEKESRHVKLTELVKVVKVIGE